jgi:Zn-dependent protease
MFGFEIIVPANALIGVGVIALLWYPEFSGIRTQVGQVALAAVFALLLMASILFHELAHAFVAQRFGYPVTGITLWAMGGFTTYHPTKKHGPGQESLIALAGPVATLAIAGVAYAASGSVPPGTISAVLAALAWANGLVGFFNLLPGSPLDGGAVVKSLVWALTGSQRKGMVVSGWVGRALAILIVVSPFLLALRYGGQPSLVLIVVAVTLAWLLWNGASATLSAAESGHELAALSAQQLARPIEFIGPGSTVADAIGQVRPDALLMVTDQDGTPTGVVMSAAARAVPDAERGRVSAMAVSARLEQLPVVPADSSALDVLRACQQLSARFVFLADPGGGRPRAAIDTDAAFVTEGP